MTLTQLQESWQDTPEAHKHIHELFTDLVNKDEMLKAHRDWCDANFHGLGERSFGYLWKLICEELLGHPTMCEIGVLRGQIISLWKLLKPTASIVGITPLDSSGGVWESDYRVDIKNIHDHFELPQPIILHGKSQEERILNEMKGSLLNCLYIDGSHEYLDVSADLNDYTPMVVKGGWLIIDDACTDMNQWWGAFQGLVEVTQATLDFMAENGKDWEFFGNVMHLRIYRRK